MRWAITHKMGQDGMGIKARLAARGFQDPAVKAGSLGVGACVAARLSSLHVLFAAAQRKWGVVKIDPGCLFEGREAQEGCFSRPTSGSSVSR